MNFISLNRFLKVAWLLVASTLLASCGGGGGDSTSGSTTCDLASQKDWLRDYMQDAYYWSGVSPNPDPAAFDTVQKYFDALLYTGDQVIPKDRWSYIQDSAAYNQFFGAGKTLGYGVFVNGLELKLPLKLRYTEPQSPAAAAGLKRGDIIVSVNGRSAAELIAANDFALLTPAKAGDTLTLDIIGDAGARTVILTAVTYDLTPVSAARVLDLPGRGKAGYVLLKDFVSQAETPLADAFAQFRAAGASFDGRVFTQLKYNGKHSGSDNAFRMVAGPAPAFSRVVVITGQRTCSASELIVNGLKPYVNVVTVGDTSCGKPFGFNPVESCGRVYSAVNFESTNSLGQGRYYAGITASCPAADDFSGVLGDATESLTQAATRYLQTGACPMPLASALEQRLRSPNRAAAIEVGERPGQRLD